MKTGQFFLFLLSLWFAADLSAQGKYVSVVETIEGGVRVRDESDTTYTDYRPVKGKENHYIGVSYKDSVKLSVGGYHRFGESRFIKAGYYRSYYDNGSLNSEGMYVLDTAKQISYKQGNWLYYYKSGKLWMEGDFIDSLKGRIMLLANFWDSTGTQTVENGKGRAFYIDKTRTADTLCAITFSGLILNGRQNGEWKGYYENGNLYCVERYDIGRHIRGVSYDAAGKEYVYDSLSTQPVYPGGDAALLRFLKKNMKYPLSSIRNYNEARVVVRFDVERDGKVSNAKLLWKGPDKLNEESLRVVALLNGFKPATLRGQKVKTTFTLPFVFALR